MTVRFPGVGHRCTIIGKTGSGKTQAGAFILSKSPFDRQPYIIIDYKRDVLLNSISRVREIGVNEKIPKQSGLYIVHPRPDEDDAVEALLWRAWEHEKVGLFFDEGSLAPGNRPGARAGAFAAIMRQGRSKRVPAIVCTQRPAGISRDCFSEADFFALFYLNTKPDLDRVKDMMPYGVGDGLAQNYHWRWYDVGRDQLTYFTPVPDADTIVDRIDARLAPRRRLF